MTAAPTPAALPPHVLERADVRSALASHDFGRVFYLARKYAPHQITYSKIAEAINLKPERVGTLAKGEGRISRYDKILEVADGLRIPGHLIGLAPRPWETSSAAPGLERRDQPNSLLISRGEDLWEVAELVRQAEISTVEAGTMEMIQHAFDQLARAYPYAPSDQLHVQTRNGLKWIMGQLNGRTTLKQHRELLVDAGWLFLLDACVQYDRGARETANLSKAAALRIGTETGHGEIQAWAWEIEAWFSLTQGRWNDMLAAVEAGHVADSTHSVGVQLYAHKARALARLGEERAVRDALDAGRARLDRLPRPDHPEHHFIIDPDKWDFYEMDAYRILGDDGRAATHARSVINISTLPDGSEISPMRAAEARLTLALASARIGDLDEAIGESSRALSADRKSLPSLLLLGHELDKELRARFPRETTTQDFHERITALTRGV